MNYSSRTKHDSALKNAAGELLYPGVSFVTARMNERRRVKREIVLADLRMRVNEQQEALMKAIDEKATLAPGILDKMNATFGDLLHGEWYPAWIRWGLVSIDGFDIDGAPATVSTLCEAGPTDLAEEIFLTIIKESGLSTPETKNSPQPSTSGAPADGATESSTATTAEPADGGKTETAPSSDTPAT